MGIPAAPRLDERLIRRIADEPITASAADVTRSVGALAWELGLPRPSYQAVRLACAELRPARAVAPHQTSPGQIVWKTLEFLYQYPGPGLADWYGRYKRGMG